MKKMLFAVIVTLVASFPAFSQEPKPQYYPGTVYQGRYWPAGNYVKKDGVWYRDGNKEEGLPVVNHDLIEYKKAQAKAEEELRAAQPILRERINLYNPYATPIYPNGNITIFREGGRKNFNSPPVDPNPILRPRLPYIH